jgi:hypothetical protein
VLPAGKVRLWNQEWQLCDAASGGTFLEKNVSNRLVSETAGFAARKRLEFVWDAKPVGDCEQMAASGVCPLHPDHILSFRHFTPSSRSKVFAWQMHDSQVKMAIVLQSVE